MINNFVRTKTNLEGLTMQNNQTGKPLMKSIKRSMVVVIALLTAVGTTAFAAPNAENFNMFIDKKAKTMINETQVVEGIKMTVENEIIQVTQ